LFSVQHGRGAFDAGTEANVQLGPHVLGASVAVQQLAD
jgi:hypothetical protein